MQLTEERAWERVRVCIWIEGCAWHLKKFLAQCRFVDHYTLFSLHLGIQLVYKLQTKLQVLLEISFVFFMCLVSFF